VAVAFRVANHDTPFWVNPNRSAGRYNAAGDPPTQYLTLHPLGCVAEVLRGQDLRTPERLRERMVRIWAVRIDLGDAERLAFDDAAAHGLDPRDLIADDQRACRRWARGVRGAGGPSTWIVPNAALPGTENVVVFGERVLAPYHQPPVDAELDVPATIVGDLSLLPEVVLAQTRFRGRPHAGYEAWRRGAPYDYREPVTYPLPPVPAHLVDGSRGGGA
jgi:hypothetical protein